MPTSYPNPNRALRRKPVPHPVRTAIRRGIVVFLAVLLTLSLFFTLCITGIRAAMTPEFVYRFAEGISYIDLPLPTGDGFITVADLLVEGFNSIQLPLSRQDVAELFDQFSIPTIAAGFAQDLVSWLLYDGPRPVLDPYAISEIVLSGMEPGIVQILAIFGDPASLLAESLAQRLAHIRLDAMLDSLEPVRLLLSADTCAWAVSITGMLAVLLYCACLFRLPDYVLPLGSVLFASGLALLITAWLLPLSVPGITVVYADLLLSLLSPLSGQLCRYAVFLLLLGAVGIGLGILVWLAGRMQRTASLPRVNPSPARPE